MNKDKDRKTQRYKDRKTERQKDLKTEKKKDRETDKGGGGVDDYLWLSAGYASASPPGSNHLELKFKERGR